MRISPLLDQRLLALLIVLTTLLGAPLVPVLTAEDDLADSDGLRGDLHALILVGEVQGPPQGSS